MFEKDLNEQQKCHILNLPPPLLRWWWLYKYAASNVQQVCEAEFTPGTRHAPLPPVPCVTDKDDVRNCRCLSCVFAGVFQ